jgi:hypothetical protein
MCYGSYVQYPLTTTTAVVPQPLTYSVSWPPQPAEGWRCPDCTLVLAPWMSSHRCADTAAAMLCKDDQSDRETGSE